MLDHALLVPPHNTLQAILDCVPPATRILVEMKKVPIGDGLIIDQSVTITSKVGGTELECPADGIKIRYVIFL